MSVTDNPNDIQLKFDGDSIKRLDGAPADALIASLSALQRMVHIIGMRAEGRNLSERVKPTEKVKREYAIVCRSPQRGSHMQPLAVASQNGVFTAAAAAAREKLLRVLKAFDSGRDDLVEEVLPNPRERWFMAKAALGLLPPTDSGLEVTVRGSSRGPFSFSAARARVFLTKYEKGSPPEVDEEVVVGKLRAIDFARTIMTIKPSHDPALRLDYPLQLEGWLTANVRRRLRFSGRPVINQKGDVSSFTDLHNVSELEATLEPIEEFKAGAISIAAIRPLSIPITVSWKERLFIFQDKNLGIDAFSPSYSGIRDSIIEDLDILWRHYALAPDDDLDFEAQSVKSALLSRFKMERR